MKIHGRGVICQEIEINKGVHQGCVLALIPSNLFSGSLLDEALSEVDGADQ